MSSRSMSLVFTFAASACLMAGSAPAQPSTVKAVVVRPLDGVLQTHTETVSFADLDLGHRAGAKALLTRISGAARRVCGPAPETHESDGPFRHCVTNAVDRAVIEINLPAVNALHAGG